jgi:hypothetical protein
MLTAYFISSYSQSPIQIIQSILLQATSFSRLRLLKQLSVFTISILASFSLTHNRQIEPFKRHITSHYSHPANSAFGLSSYLE